jgi:hypothetical protein
MRNAKRDPLTNEQRHTLIDAIDASGGVDVFCRGAALGRESVARALTGAGVLPSTRAILIAKAEAFVFGLAARARSIR